MASPVQRNGFHEVVADRVPDDTRRVCPLIGNDEIKLCVDARGVMHDFTHIWGSHPPARINWTGRRHDRRQDRYNCNMFEWGFVDLQFAGESDLPAVTGWRQRLCPREGYVETEIRRGEVVERTISFVHLERNVIVFRRSYENLPAGVSRRLKAIYTLCMVGTDELPFRVRWQPNAPTARGISAETDADGMWRYRGRVSLLADADVSAARAEGNRLSLDLELPADGAITVCLSLADDLGDHPQLLDIQFPGWMTGPVREVWQENKDRLAAWKPNDYAAESDAVAADLASGGFDGLFRTHRAAWEKWFSQVRVELPAEEQQLRAALDSQLYTMRCNYTHWSMPANPFNTSWGAPYFWDERFPIEGLMRLGVWDMPRRTVEWRRAILPFSTMMSGGRGARYVPAAIEPGAQISERGCTQYYEFFTIGVIVNYLYEYLRYHDDEQTWRRFYPIIRESAEFFRRYLVIELPGNNVMLTWLVDVDETNYPVQDGPFATCGATRALELAASIAGKLGINDPLADEWRRLGALMLHLSQHLCGGKRLDRKTGQTTADNPVTPWVDYELADSKLPAVAVDKTVEAWRDEYRSRSEPQSQMEEGKTNLAGEATHLPFWSWGPLQHAHSAATLGRPREALDKFRLSLTTLMDFGALNESAATDLSDVHHPWFNTAAGAYARALARMLVYPKDDAIVLLPGIPEGWREFSFTLPVFGAGEIRVAVGDGKLTDVTVHQLAGKPRQRVVHLPKRYLPAKPALADGVEVVREDDSTLAVRVPADGGGRVLAN